MNKRQTTRCGLLLAGALAATVVMAGTLWAVRNVAASPPAGPLAQGGAPLLLNYQGRLADPATGLPEPDGTYSITFALYSGDQGGSSLWSETQVVSVTQGLFNVLLGSNTPLSPSHFDGSDRWLELTVEGETLAPRIRLASAPYAIRAAEAQNADTLDDKEAAAFADATHDHDADYVNEGQEDGVTSSMILTDGLDADTVDGLHASQLRDYQNVVVVAKSGGDYASIGAALDSITDAADGNPYLVFVGPGTYTETVTMKPHVDIQGAGELVTTITYQGSQTFSTGTVVGADDAELRHLTVENTGGNTYAVAIYNGSASPRLSHVTASASGAEASAYGVCNVSSSPTMSHVTASAREANYAFAVSNYRSSPTLRHVTASARDADPSYGVANRDSSPTIRNSVISSGVFGIYNAAGEGAYTVTVDNSQIAGGSYAIYNVDCDCTTRLGGSRLEGDVSTSGGTVTCAGVYDGDYTFYADTCP